VASASLQVAKKIGAHFIITSGSAGTHPNDDTTAIVSKHLKIYGSTLGSREEFRQLMSFMAVKQIKPIVDSVFPLREASAAQQHLGSGQAIRQNCLTDCSLTTTAPPHWSPNIR